MLLTLAVPAVAFAGCVDPTDDGSLADADVPALDATATRGLSAIIAATSSGKVIDDATATFMNATFRIAATGHHRGEPTIGVTSDGTMFMPAGASVAGGSGRVIRSRDNGATWEDVTDPLLGPKADLDPWVFVDTATDRVYHAPLYVACTWMSWSDNGGDSWFSNPVTGCGTPGHDHQKITAGPPAPGTTTRGYPSVIYYAYNSFRGEGTVFSRSLDGGLTFTDERVIHAQDECHGGLNGPIHAALDTTVYVPKQVCGGVDVLVSRDSGLTWTTVPIPDATAPSRFFSPMIESDADGNAFLTWNGEDAQMYLATSTDKGASWSTPVRVSPPGVTATHMSVIAANGTGRVAIAYLATDADTSKWTTRTPHDASPDTRWHLMVSFIADALANDPVIVTHRVTPEDDPVQIGRIWQGGGTEPKRNLRDFIGMTERDGRVYVAYADGCPKGCTTSAESVGNEVTAAILNTGASLAGAFGGLREL